VTVVKPSYLTYVDKLLIKTGPRIVANYFCWRIIDQMLPYLNQDARYIKNPFCSSKIWISQINLKTSQFFLLYRNIVRNYTSKVKGKSSDPPRWHRCVHALGFNNYAAHAIAIPAAAMFVKHFVDKQEKGDTK
jgi:hypothetical protein